MTGYGVLEIVWDHMGAPMDHRWHTQISGRLMSEREAHELRTMLTAASTTTGRSGRSSYRVCAYVDKGASS